MSLRGYGVIIAAFFAVSIAYSVRYGFDMLLPGMLDSLKISNMEEGMFSAVYFCTYTVFTQGLAVLSDPFAGSLAPYPVSGLAWQVGLKRVV